ncbi:MAG: hypothetical protein IJ088_00600, partial [Clostridia bacterium]|nr:hypothetical protein [Clostridia bacterium]
MRKTGFQRILCVFLLLAVLAFAGVAESFNAQIVLRDADGTEAGTIDLIPVTNSAGETGYWFNLFGLDEQRVQLLQSGNSVIRAFRQDTGEQMPDVLIPADAGMAALYDGENVHRSDVADPQNEVLHFPVLSSYMDAPADQSALDGLMQSVGFTAPEQTQTPYEPEETEAPYEPEETEAPYVPEVTEAPYVPEETEVPYVPEETEVPYVPEETEVPYVPEVTEAPYVPEVTEAPVITIPRYMVPQHDAVEMRQEAWGNVIGYTGPSDVLTGISYMLDAEGQVWFGVYSAVNDFQGYVNSAEVMALEETEATYRIQAILEEKAQANAPSQGPEVTEAPVITVPPYMVPQYDYVEIRQDPEGNVLGYTGPTDVLTGLGYVLDAEGHVWYSVHSVVSDIQGVVSSDETAPLEE